MPIYEYYCPSCNGRFNHLARRFDEPAPACPACGSLPVSYTHLTLPTIYSV